MNKIESIITKIDNIDNLNIVEFQSNNIKLKMMSLGLSSEMKVGQKVEVTAKPTSIAIAKEFSGIVSYSNQIEGKIDSINQGELLSCINIKFDETVIESIITTSSVKNMNLLVDDIVTVFIKASELSISKVL